MEEQLADRRDAVRSRLRTMRRGLQTLHRLRRRVGEDKAEQRKAVSTKLIAAAAATIRQVERIRTVLQGVSGERTTRAQQLVAQIDHYRPLVQQVINQAERGVLEGRKVPAKDKLVSLFEAHARIIPRHKVGTDVEFGRLVVIDEVDGGIFTRSGVVSKTQQEKERERSWRRRYRWRAGIEGRLSSVRRDYGLWRCPDYGEEGSIRHIGWGIIASTLRHIGQHLAAKAGA